MRDDGILSKNAQLQTARIVLQESFASLPFPIEKEVAIARVGATALPMDKDLTLGDILRGLPDTAFRDPFRATRAADERMTGIARSLATIARAEKLSK